MASEESERSPITQEQYLTALRREAEEKAYQPDQFEMLCQYAERLISAGLPVIFDQEHLALVSGFKKNFLYAVTNDASLFYKNYYVKKRSGGSRRISEPMPDLKILQRWLLDNIISHLTVSKFAHAFRRSRSIKTNARFHIARDTVVKIDFADFFGSITTTYIYSLMTGAGYTRPVASLIAGLCTLDGSLPQGAPTSAAVSNAIMYDFDEDIGAWALQNGWRYSRYADDLTFSGSGNPREIFQRVHKAASAKGLTVNASKSRVMRRGARQVICGIVVNKGMAPPRNFLRKLRQEIYYIERFGVDAHVSRIGARRARYAEVLRGRLAHAAWLLEHDPRRVEQIKDLGRRLELAVSRNRD